MPRLVTVLATAFVLLGAGAAQALAVGTVSVDDNGDGTKTLRFTAPAGDVNNVTVTQGGSVFTVTDTGTLINEAAPECTGGGTSTVVCTDAAIEILVAALNDGNDRLETNAALLTSVQGGAGNDTMLGGPSTDTLLGQAGDDHAEGRGGDDEFQLGGTDGDDTLIGGPGFDHLRGSSGFLEPGIRYTLGDGIANDGRPLQRANLIGIEDLDSGEGVDFVRGTNDPNVVTTFDGDDDIDLLGGPDTLDAGSQNDTIEARDGFGDRIRCGSGTDTVRADQLDQLSGCENVTVTAVVPFGTVPDRVYTLPTTPGGPPPTLAGCPAGKNVLVLSLGDDVRNGTVGADLIFATDGNDVIDALAGNDCIDLGTGNDRGQGGPGNDLVVGAAGDDVATGSDGNDRLTGDAGNDRLLGNTGNDGLAGGAGADSLQGGFGDDRLGGESGNDVVSGSRGRDRVGGGSGGDRLSGGSSADTVSGGAGGDRLSGGSSGDRLSGGAGNDRIAARDGARDRVSCGSGRDSVSADRIDRVGADCERVRRR